MSDIKQRIQTLLSRPQLAGLATITPEGKPWVRYIMAITAPDLTVRCATFKEARKVAQIAATPEVHLTCGVASPTEMAPYVQIQATATFKTDEAERHAFWNDMLAPLFDGPDDPRYGVIVMTPYRIELCSPGSLEPEVWSA